MLELSEVLSDFAAWAELDSTTLHNPSLVSADGSTPLHFMALLGDIQGTLLLLNAGVNINAVDKHGNTAIHTAVTARQHSVVEMLTSYGAKTDIRNNQGFLPLDIAIIDKYHPTIEALTEN